MKKHDEIDPTRYAVTIQKIDTEGETVFEATVRELPHAADYADTAAEAYDLMLQTIEGLYELSEMRGRDFPKPLPRC